MQSDKRKATKANQQTVATNAEQQTAAKKDRATKTTKARKPKQQFQHKSIV